MSPLPPSGGGVVKSDYARTILQHTPFSPTRQLRLDISSCHLITVSPNLIMKRHPTPLQVISHHCAEERFDTTQ